MALAALEIELWFAAVSLAVGTSRSYIHAKITIALFIKLPDDGSRRGKLYADLAVLRLIDRSSVM